MAEVAKPNTRMRWHQLPSFVHSWVEGVLGEPVVSAVSQPGGFSPGTADRLTGASGGRLFVKSVSRTVNRRSYELFRTEAEVWRALHGVDLPAPTFRGVAEHDDWIMLAFDDVDDREAGGDDADIASVFSALDRLPDARGRFDLPAAPGKAEREAGGELARWAADWPTLVTDGAALIPGRARPHLSELSELVAEAGRAAGGDRLAHLDLRPDNVVLDAGGSAWLVDWPWVGLAAPWFDKVSYLAGLVTTRPLANIDRWASGPRSALGAAPPDDVDAVLAAQAGTLLWQSGRPAPATLAGLRGFQRSFGLRILDWVALRRGWWNDEV